MDYRKTNDMNEEIDKVKSMGKKISGNTCTYLGGWRTGQK
jgi:hypothetical protein